MKLLKKPKRFLLPLDFFCCELATEILFFLLLILTILRPLFAQIRLGVGVLDVILELIIRDPGLKTHSAFAMFFLPFIMLGCLFVTAVYEKVLKS